MNTTNVIESANVAAATSVNVDLLAGLLSSNTPAVVGVDITASEFRAKILHRYQVQPFGSYAEWSCSNEGLEYRQKAENLSKDKQRVAAVLVSVYDRLKEEWDKKEASRVVAYSLSDMVDYIGKTCDKEFRALVGCSVRDVPTSPLSAWSLVPDRFSKRDELVQTILTSDQLAVPGTCLSALLSYRHRYVRLTDEVSKESAKVARYAASVADGATKAVALGASLEDYLERCQTAYLAAVDAAKVVAIDTAKIADNIARLRKELADVDGKLADAVGKKRTAAAKKLTADVVRMERQISDGLRVLDAAGYDTTELRK